MYKIKQILIHVVNTEKIKNGNIFKSCVILKLWYVLLISHGMLHNLPDQSTYID